MRGFGKTEQQFCAFCGKPLSAEKETKPVKVVFSNDEAKPAETVEQPVAAEPKKDSSGNNLTWGKTIFGISRIIAVFCAALFIIGVLGAGDIKLFSVLSTFLTLKETGTLIILSFVLGAAGALFKMLSTNELLARITYFSSYASLCIRQRKLLPYARAGKNSVIHFSVPIFISFILTEVIS